MRKIALLLLFVFCLNTLGQTRAAFDIQGHRGCRGLLPENTVPAFLKALELGVNTLELDTVISKDKKIVVSHEPFFSAEISLDPKGQPISPAREKDYNLYQMSYAEIMLYDVGSIGNKRFPEQQKMRAYKPLLREVFQTTQQYIRQHKLPAVKYNIETKSAPAGDNSFHPLPAVFAKLLYDEILRNKIQKFVTIQSFDVRTLQAFKKFPIKMPLVLLVENKDGIEANIIKLGFQPAVYSPHFSLVDQATVDYCRQHRIKVIPWTINEIADMERMKQFALDGIITDYPERAISLFRQ